MKQNKIDQKVLLLMSDEDLSQHLPLYGDRLAVKNFCTRQSGTGGKSKRKKHLLKKLNKRLHKPLPASDSESESESESSVHMATSRSKWSGNRSAAKSTRRIELGWLHLDEKNETYKQVRSQTGGGTRHRQQAIDLFFPEGKSKRGSLVDFHVSIRDFKYEEADPNATIETLYERSKMRILRFYLTNAAKEASSSDELPDLKLKRREPNTKQDKGKDDAENVPEVGTEMIIECTSVLGSHSFEGIACGSPAVDPLPDLHCTETLSSDGNSDPIEVAINDDSEIQFGPFSPEFGDASGFTLANTFPQQKVIMKIHRGQCLKEMISHFKDPSILSTDLSVVMILPNGSEELGAGDGMLKDCLSEFWNEFYEVCCTGHEVKVPTVRHDFQVEEWRAIARIIYKGWQAANYFPIYLSPVAIEEAMFGGHFCDLTRAFLTTLPPPDRKTIETALENFSSVDNDELMEVFDNLQCRTFVSKENVVNIVQEIAHKELIQKPKYVIDCWTHILRDMGSVMSPQDLTKIYSDLLPTTRKVAKILVPPDEMSDTERETMSHL